MRLTASFSSVSTQFPAAVTICSLKLILWSHERLFLQGLGAFGKGLNISLLSTGLGLLQGTVESRNNLGRSFNGVLQYLQGKVSQHHCWAGLVGPDRERCTQELPPSLQCPAATQRASARRVLNETCFFQQPNYLLIPLPPKFNFLIHEGKM